MKKICFLIGNLSSSGGTERVTTLIANNLVEYSKYEISILSLVDGKNPFFDLNPGISIFSLNEKKISFKSNFLSTVWKIRKFLQEYEINTLIVVDTIACIFTIPALFGLKVKHICWEHFNFNNNNGIKLRDFSRKLAVKYCDHIITLTEKDKSVWLNNLKNINAQVTAIANPCPFSIQNHIKEKNTKIVLAVGRLTHVKGFDILLEAWVQVNKAMPEWKLKIVGDGEDKLILSEFIKYNQLTASVELVGKTDNVSKYYKEAEIFCLSSRYEGFPMVLLETLAFGLPVISFDCETGPAEILADTDSILIPQDNINLFASSLINLMKNEEKRGLINPKSKEKAKLYQPQFIIQQWIKLLDSF
ncbi:glycosyltransferase family 4 protein [Acinetobacter radioresistens]|uniref:glycosyltransferase family 4 protein n=1 Tax=Acinetobacter radioresistens TaxID=40216 RepID=UPI0021CDBC76|nr:glycosyltransferase family 4 protein [Acinetobacter radioresistens]MCU4566595.1 glycosyltransferase family 4 protein [Acinetobacter radioresistens]